MRTFWRIGGRSALDGAGGTAKVAASVLFLQLDKLELSCAAVGQLAASRPDLRVRFRPFYGKWGFILKSTSS